MTHNWNLKHDPERTVMLEDIKLLREALKEAQDMLNFAGGGSNKVDEALLATEKYGGE